MSTLYQESTAGTLPFYNEGYEQLTDAGKAAAQTPYNPYTGQQVAGLTPQQQQAFGLASSSVGNYAPFMQGAQNAVGTAQGQAQFDPNQVQQYLNPYLGGVVNEIGRLGQEQFQNQIVPTLSNAYSSLGQFGSARQGMMLSDAGARNQREVLGQQSNALQTGYDSAMAGYQDWSQMGMDTNLRAGTALGNLGQAEQQLAIGDYGQLLNAGQLQQMQEQRGLDNNFANYMDERNYPWEQVQKWGSLFQSAPNTTNSWSSTFKKGGLARFKEGGQVRKMQGGGQFEDSSDIDTILAQLSNRRPSAPQQQGAGNVADYARSMGMMRDMQPPPGLEQRPTPVLGERIGRGLMEAAAQGPAHWGQIIGRAGKSYYDQEDTLAADNANRTVATGELMGLGGKGRGASNFEGKVVPGVGLVNYDPNTGEANVAMSENRVATMLPQIYAHAVREASAASWPNEQVKREWIDRRVQQMLSDAASRGAGVRTPGEGSLPGGMPPGVTPIGMPQSSPQQPARFQAAGGDVAQAMKDIESIADPVERQMAMEALQRSYPQGRAQPQEAWPSAYPTERSMSAFNTGQILSPQEAAESERVGKGMGETYVALQDGAGAARGRIAQIDRILGLSDGITTGKLTPLVTEIQGWAESLGVPQQYIEGLPEKQAFESLVSQLALEFRNPAGGAGMPGALSDRDLIFLVGMVPGLSKTPEGNKLILETFRKVADRQLKVAELARQYRRDNPRGVFDDGFQDYLAEWSSQNQLFSGADFERAGIPMPGSPNERIRISLEDLE